jgi:hypothetical protein
MCYWHADGQFDLHSKTTGIKMDPVEIRWIRQFKTVTSCGLALVNMVKKAGSVFESLSTYWLTGVCYNNI